MRGCTPTVPSACSSRSSRVATAPSRAPLAVSGRCARFTRTSVWTGGGRSVDPSGAGGHEAGSGAVVRHAETGRTACGVRRADVVAGHLEGSGDALALEGRNSACASKLDSAHRPALARVVTRHATVGRPSRTPLRSPLHPPRVSPSDDASSAMPSWWTSRRVRVRRHRMSSGVEAAEASPDRSGGAPAALGLCGAWGWPSHPATDGTGRRP